MPTAIHVITGDFAVAAFPAARDFAAFTAAGFHTVIDLLPAGEVAAALSPAAARAAAQEAGLAYHHVPANKLDLFTDDVVRSMTAALAASQGRVLAYCRSGQRAAVVWAAARARELPVERVLGELRGAGFDFDFLRDDLDRQADRMRWLWPASGASLHPA